MGKGRSARRSPVLALVTVVAACSAGPSVSNAPPSPTAMATVEATGPVAVLPGEPWILFQQFRDTAVVVLARPDGSDLHSPTAGVPGSNQTNPDWSPDGSQIVFARLDNGVEDLWVVNADGTGARSLAACEDACLYLDDPDWSPDGRTVLYSRSVTSSAGDVVSTLEQVDVVSGRIEVIVTADPGFFYAGQRWSPDGRSIVLEIVELAGTSIDSDIVDVSLAIIDPADPAPAGRALMPRGTFPETAAWAPGGEQIIFAALETPGASGTDLYAIAPDGTGLRRLTTLVDEGGNATHPDVAPDGSSIIFSSSPSGRGGVLATVDIDGGEVRSALGAFFVPGVHPRFRPMP